MRQPGKVPTHFRDCSVKASGILKCFSKQWSCEGVCLISVNRTTLFQKKQDAGLLDNKRLYVSRHKQVLLQNYESQLSLYF